MTASSEGCRAFGFSLSEVGSTGRFRAQGGYALTVVLASSLWLVEEDTGGGKGGGWYSHPDVACWWLGGGRWEVGGEGGQISDTYRWKNQQDLWMD